jgi:hypothetical protein
MSKKINVLEIIMTEEAVDDKDIGNDISNLIQLIESKGFLLQHREGIAEAIDANPINIDEDESSV